MKSYFFRCQPIKGKRQRVRWRVLFTNTSGMIYVVNMERLLLSSISFLLKGWLFYYYLSIHFCIDSNFNLIFIECIFARLCSMALVVQKVTFWDFHYFLFISFFQIIHILKTTSSVITKHWIFFFFISYLNIYFYFDTKISHKNVFWLLETLQLVWSLIDSLVTK